MPTRIDIIPLCFIMDYFRLTCFFCCFISSVCVKFCFNSKGDFSLLFFHYFYVEFSDFWSCLRRDYTVSGGDKLDSRNVNIASAKEN